MLWLSKKLRVRPLSTEPVEVQIIGSDFLDIVHVRDIGLGGVGVWIPHGFGGCDTSTAVELILTLPSRKSFQVEGLIRHHSAVDEQKGFFGVKFLHLSRPQRKRIEEYLRGRIEQDPSSIRPDK